LAVISESFILLAATPPQTIDYFQTVCNYLSETLAGEVYQYDISMLAFSYHTALYP
jgi:hypothetical protein